MVENFEIMNVKNLTRICEKRLVGNTRRGKQKTREEMLKHYMKKRNLSIEDFNDGEKWRRFCRQTKDPDISG